MQKMSESGVVENLRDALIDMEDRAIETGLDLVAMQNYEEAGVLTRNQGLVLRFRNGQVFQMTVVEATR